MRRLFLRCDATRSGGIGHAMRSLALAEAALAAGWTVRLGGTIESPLVLAEVRRLGIETGPGSDDPAELASAAAGADVLHVDSYADLGDLQAEARARGVLLSSAEDGTWGRRPADVVVDGHPRAVAEYRPASAGADLLLGPEYLPLRAALAAKAREAGEPSAELGRVLVLMGGTDAFGATDLVAGLLAELPDAPLVRAVGGAAGPGIEPVPPGDLLGLLDGVDLVVTAGGTSVWELAALGVPMAVVQVTANQAENCAYLTGQGLALGLGTLDELRERGLPGGTAEALRDRAAAGERAARGRALVDGQGAARVVAAWEDRLSATGVTVRPARAGDASRLFDWRNDPAARAASRDTLEVPWEAHTGWLARVLADPRRRLLIARVDGDAVGTVRFDLLASGDEEVSLTLAPSARGRGLATPVLEAAIAAHAPTRPGPVRLAAAMRPENAASQRAFRAAGFTDDPRTPEPGMVRLVRPLPAV